MQTVPAKIKNDQDHASPYQFPVVGGLGNLQHVSQSLGLTKLEFGALTIAGQMCFSYDNTDQCAARAVELAGAVLDLCRKEEDRNPSPR